MRSTDILNKKIIVIYFRTVKLNEMYYSEYFIKLENNFTFQLLPYCIKPVDFKIGNDFITHELPNFDCMIDFIFTDSINYNSAIKDKNLDAPPYDDVYIKLDNNKYIANRFITPSENDLIFEDIDILREISEEFYDYFTRKRIFFSIIVLVFINNLIILNNVLCY